MSWFDEWTLEQEKKKKEEEEKKKGLSGDIAPVASTYLTGGVPNSGTMPVSAKLQGDLAPVLVRPKEQKPGDAEQATWFQKGAFEDGYQKGDIVRTAGATAVDAGEDALAGGIGIGETLLDTLNMQGHLYAEGQFYQNGGGYNVELEQAFRQGHEVEEKAIEEFIAKDLYDEAAIAKRLVTDATVGRRSLIDGTVDYEAPGWWEAASVLGEKADSLMQSAGQLAATMGLQAVGVPWWLTTGATTFGAEAENALKEGASFDEAALSATIAAGAEILTEQISSGIRLGGNTLDDALTKEISRAITSKYLRTAAKMGLDVFGEGAEEWITEDINRFGQWLTYRSDEELKELLWSEEAMDEKLDAFIGGSLMGGFSSVTGAARASAKGMDYASEMTNSEKAVVDKVYKDAVAQEAKNGEVTEARKREIYDDVLQQLEDGGFSIETIEEVLGGDAWRDYAQLRRYQQEYDKLYNMKYSEKSSKDTAREEQLKKWLEDSEGKSRMDPVQKRLHEEVSKLAANSRLAESYNEQRRRGQKFEADVTQYAPKMRPTIQKAIDSGILNNKRSTHKFVELVAKITAEKGVTFDFTNNERLKESGFAIEGKTVNGYVTAEGITLNIDSPRALNRVVGHEVTHVLEGTELYAELQEMLISMADAKGELQARTKALETLYEGVEGADITQELTAELVGDYLFKDTEFIEQLSTESPDLFDKVWNEIKYLCKVATAGSKEGKQLLAVRKKFEEVYREAGAKNTVPEDGVRYSFSGESSKTADRSALELAKELQKQGAENETIRQKTGWYQGMDGQWRYEIDDSQMEIVENISNYMRLGDLMKHDALYGAYPDLADIDVVFQSLEPGVYGSYNPTFDSINLSYELKEVPLALKDALAHEIQHAIQHWEGFTKGATVEKWERRKRQGFDSRRAADVRKAQETEQELRRIQEEEPQFYLDMVELDAMTPAVDRGKVDWDTLEQIEEDPPEWQAYDARREELEAKYGDMKVWDMNDLLYQREQAAKNMGRSGVELYFDTAGEIEARDVANRRSMTPEQRKATSPRLGDEDTVFAEEDRRNDQAIGKTTDNKPFVTIDTDILAGVPNQDWVKTVTDNLRKKYPSGIKVGRNSILVDKQSRKEMTFSKYTRWLMHNDPSLYEDKLRATNNLDEIIQAATDWVNEGLNHSRKDNITDFARGNVLLKIGGKQYSAEVVVGTRKNGAMIIYDLLKITPAQFTEKEMNMVITENPSPEADRNAMFISNKNIPQSIPGVKHSLSASGEDIAPLPGEVYGKDVGLENLAPVREDLGERIVPESGTDMFPDDFPIREDIQIETTKQKLEAIRENSRQELARNEQLRQESHDGYTQKIEAAQAKFDGKKNKGTKTAQALLRRIERLKRLQADEDARYAKRISDIKRRMRKTDEELQKDHTKADALTRAIARIDKYLESDKAMLAEEYSQTQAEFADKDAWVGNRALALYQELRNLKKGTKASGALSYLLDLRAERNEDWNNLRAALVNVRHTPGRVVNPNSAMEQAVRELLNEDFESAQADAELEYQEQVEKLEAEAEEKRTAARTANQRKIKNQEHTEMVKGLIGDTTTWVDKPLGIQYATNTLHRNLRDVVRGADGKTDYARADAIFDYLGGTYNHHEARLKKEDTVIKKWYQDQKITKEESVYIQMLGEFLHNPDTTVTAQMVEEYYEEHKKKIDTPKVYEVIDHARADYDKLFNRLNQVLREQGMKEIPYRKGYFPHLKMEGEQSLLAKILNWKKTDNKIPTDIAGMTEQLEPTRSWQSFSKQRQGDTTDFDFRKGFDAYVHGALDWIYHIEDIQKRRALENYIRYIHSNEGIKAQIDAVYENDLLNADQVQDEIDRILKEANNPLGNFVTDLRTQTNLLANKKHSLDRGMEQLVNRDVYSVASNISSRVSANMVAGSISAMVSNFIPITQSWGEVSPKYTLIALKDTLKTIVRDDYMVESSDFLTNRLIEEEKLDKGAWDKIGEGVGIMMTGVDHLVSQTVWRSKYRQNLSQGMSESAAIKNADQFAENLMAGRSRGNQPTLFESKNMVTKMLTAFQLEVNNQYGYLFKDLPAEMRNEAKGKLVSAYGKIFIGAYLCNALSTVITGREMAFDPIRILQELIGGMADEEEDDSEDIKEFAENVLEQVPFVGGLIGGGRVPISSALPYDGNLMDAVTGVAEAAESGDWKSVWSELQNPLWYLLPPMAGGQIRKTAQGLAMYPEVAKLWGEELPTAGSYTDSGALRFTAGKDWGSFLQAALFGQWAGKNAQEYIDEGRTPLQKNQMEEFLSLDVPIQEYWEYRDGLKGLKTLNEKADYIASLDLPVEKKNILINNIADRDKPIDLTDYGEYANFEEFDFAKQNPKKYAFLKENGITVSQYNSFSAETKEAYSWAAQNPEKYEVAKVVSDSLTVYKRYTKALSALESDYDSDGKAISGSRKEKVVNYINDLPLDYGEKIILFKSQYPSDDTYNYEIVDYLNSRRDLSYAQIVTILEELGFEVDGDGTVTW